MLMSYLLEFLFLEGPGVSLYYLKLLMRMKEALNIAKALSFWFQNKLNLKKTHYVER